VGPAVNAPTATVVQASGGRAWQAGAPTRPYAKLFAPHAPDAPPQAPAASWQGPAPGPRRSGTVIICGMTVFQVDIPYPPPKGIMVVSPRGFPIGRIPPPACHPEPGK
jgi:hypothetical protein